MLELLVISIPVIIGFLFVSLFCRKSDFFLKLSFATGLGIGISSCLFFLWLLIFNSFKNFLFLEIGLILLLGIFLLKKNKNLKLLNTKQTTFNPVLFTIFLIGLVFALLLFISLSINEPHGAWDGLRIHNTQARFLFRGGEYWKDLFLMTTPLARPDYPLLIPGIIAKSWGYLGKETVIIPIFTAFLFTFGTIGLLFSSLSILKTKNAAILSGLILLGTQSFVVNGSIQYSDVPLSFFFLATMILLCLVDRFSNNRGLLLLAGFVAGLSAWTKNEGLLFIIAIFAARLIAIFIARAGKKHLKSLLWFAYGLLPVLAIIIYYKIFLAPPNDMFLHQTTTNLLSDLTDFSRYSKIYTVIITQCFSPLKVSIPLYLLLIYSLLMGVNLDKGAKLGVITIWITLLFLMIGYFIVYLITPYDLNWQLDTSLNRILIQIWPSVIFAFFMITNVPDALMKNLKNVKKK